MASGASGDSSIIVVHVAGARTVGDSPEGPRGAGSADRGGGGVAGRALVVACLADADRAVVEHSGHTGTEVAAVYGHQRAGHAGCAGGSIGAAVAARLAGVALDVCILVEPCLAGACVSREESIHRGIAGGAVSRGAHTGQTARTASRTQLDSGRGLVIATHTQAESGGAVVGAVGSGVAGETHSGVETGIAATIAGRAGDHTYIVVPNHAGT